MSLTERSARPGGAVSQIPAHVKRFGAVLALLLLLPAGSPAGDEKPETARELSLSGKGYLDKGDLESALAAFSRARGKLAEEGAHDYELASFMALHLHNLGVRFNNQGLAREALRCFVEVLRLYEVQPRLRDNEFRARLTEATLGVAGYLVSAGEAPGALEAYELLEALAPGDIRQALGLGAAQLASGNLEAADAAYGKAWKLDAASAEAAAGRGQVSVAMAASSRGRERGNEAATRFESGVVWLRKAVKLEPGASRRWLALAEALSSWSDHLGWEGRSSESEMMEAEAEAALRQAIALEPASPWPTMRLATFLLRTHRYEEASTLFVQSETMLDGLISAAPGDVNLPVWRKAKASCAENRAAAAYNMAVDAVNRAGFDRADLLLEQACAVGPSWERTCRAFRQVARARRKALEERLAAHNAALESDPNTTTDLLALGDLHAMVGSYDTALGFYRRVEQRTGGQGNDPPAGLADRIASVQDPGELQAERESLKMPGGRIELTFYRHARREDLRSAVKAAWLRVSGSLGHEALGPALAVSLYPNQRSFRQNAGYRVGSLVKGHYSGGRVSIYEAPSHTVVEWVSVLTHEMAHHAVEKLSGGHAPWWLSEGVARYVEGDSAVVDRKRLADRLESTGLQHLTRLGDLVAWSWNDPEAFLDARDQALLAVEQMARIRGSEGLRNVLRALNKGAGPTEEEMGQVLVGILGIDLNQLDESLRASLR